MKIYRDIKTNQTFVLKNSELKPSQLVDENGKVIYEEITQEELERLELLKEEKLENENI